MTHFPTYLSRWANDHLHLCECVCVCWCLFVCWHSKHKHTFSILRFAALKFLFSLSFRSEHLRSFSFLSIPALSLAIVCSVLSPALLTSAATAVLYVIWVTVTFGFLEKTGSTSLLLLLLLLAEESDDRSKANAFVCLFFALSSLSPVGNSVGSFGVRFRLLERHFLLVFNAFGHSYSTIM